MGRHAMLKKEFDFLKEYGFKMREKEQSYAYDFVVWTNPYKSIEVVYNNQTEVEDQPGIYIYDADGYKSDESEYQIEFAQNRTPREKIHSAAVWLRNAIENNELPDFDAAEYRYQKECVQNRPLREKILCAAGWLWKTIKEKIHMFLRLN